MSARVDQFVDNLRDRLNTAEDRLDKVKSNIAEAKGETKSKIDRKIAEAKTTAEARKGELEEAQARMKANLEEKKAETEANIAQWKQQRHVKKLDRRAERAEEDAYWSVLWAADAIDQANLATLEAVAARIDVEAAAQNA